MVSRVPGRLPVVVVILAVLAALSFAGLAEAKVSEAVAAAFRGKIVLTRAPVAPGANDKETIAKLKAAQLSELAGAPGDEGQAWAFHYLAVVKKTGNVSLELQFVSGEQDGRLAASTSIPILDVDNPVLEGNLTIGENRGLVRGKAYQLRLVNGKGEVVAKTSAIFK